MQWLKELERLFISSPFVSNLIRWSKKMSPPGFQGASIYDVVRFFFMQMQRTGFTERASAISFNLTLAIPPAIIFLFTLFPFLPISKEIIAALFSFIRDIVPGEKNNAGLIKFLQDILIKPRSGLLSTGFLLAMYFSSNAVMGIMRSFDKNYVGFKKRIGIGRRFVALGLTLLIYVLFLATLTLLIMQGGVPQWLGIKNKALLFAINNFRWILIAALFLFTVSIIYRFGPSVHKRWRLLNPGSILATILMILATLGFSYYVRNFAHYNELYGSIGTIMILMALIFINSLVLLVGFELNVSINTLKHRAEVRSRNEQLQLEKQQGGV